MADGFVVGLDVGVSVARRDGVGVTEVDWAVGVDVVGVGVADKVAKGMAFGGLDWVWMHPAMNKAAASVRTMSVFFIGLGEDGFRFIPLAVHNLSMRSFLNGTMVDAPRVSALDEGLLYGYGVYETLRVYTGVPFRLAEHVARLRASAEKIGMHVPSESDLRDAIFKTVESNRLADAALRVVLTAGSDGDWGHAESSLLVLAKSVGSVPSRIRAITVPFHRDVAQAKSLNCLTSVLARRRAREAGVDESFFRIGRSVLEGTTCNVFALQGKVLTTPKDGVLAGVTRDVVLGLAAGLDLRIVEGPLTYDRLSQADEAFVTSTLKHVVPLVELDGKPLKQGPVVEKIQTAFSELVARETAPAKRGVRP